MKNRLTQSLVVSAFLMTAATCLPQEVPQNPATAPAVTGSTVSEKSGDSADSAGAKRDSAVLQVGGSVQPPIAVHIADPKFSQQAKRAKFSGQVVVSLIVGTDGMPHNVHVLRGIGMGLDEEAVKAVQQYRFKPATQNGKPVAVYLNVAMNFQIIPK